MPTIRRTRLVDDIADQLRELILSERLEPGQQLRQVELADQLGVSRTPLREAFRLLEGDGLVRSSNGNNTVEVIDYSVSELVALLEVREVVDGLAARLVGARSDVDLGDQRSLLADMRAAIDGGDVAAFDRLHADLHVRLLELSGNDQLRAEQPLVRVSTITLARVMRHASSEAGLPDELLIAGRAPLLAEDEAILATLEAHDGGLAESQARHHVATMVAVLTPRR